jgi:hypothetical protein
LQATINTHEQQALLPLLLALLLLVLRLTNSQ